MRHRTFLWGEIRSVPLPAYECHKIDFRISLSPNSYHGVPLTAGEFSLISRRNRHSTAERDRNTIRGNAHGGECERGSWNRARESAVLVSLPPVLSHGMKRADDNGPQPKHGRWFPESSVRGIWRRAVLLNALRCSLVHLVCPLGGAPDILLSAAREQRMENIRVADPQGQSRFHILRPRPEP